MFPEQTDPSLSKTRILFSYIAENNFFDTFQLLRVLNLNSLVKISNEN
jgi:hypothetical protein